MKISGIEIDGFRCFGEKRSLPLKEGRSLCLLAENGRGKSSVADALEYWGRGDVSWTHREGIGLAALIHLHRTEAKVEVKIDGVGVVSRRLAGKNPGSLEAGAGPMEVDFEPDALPILRHRTMVGFVDKSANDKRSELLETLGLAELSEFRRGVRSTAQKLKRLDKEAQTQLLAANGALAEDLEGKSLGVLLAELSREALLPVPLTGEQDLLAWKPTAAGQRESTNTLALADSVVEANAALRDSSLDLWDRAVGDLEKARERSLGVLLETGLHLVEQSEDDQCPLCLVDQDRDELLDRLAARASELASAEEDFRLAEDQIRNHELATSRLRQSLTNLLASDEPGLDAARDALQEKLDELTIYEQSVHNAQGTRTALDRDPPSIAEQAVEAVASDAAAAPAGIGPSLLRLARLKGRVDAVRTARSEAREATGKQKAAEAAAAIADKHVEGAVQQALDRLNAPLAQYYGELIGKSIYSDVKLTYTEGRAGGIEFEFKWNGEHSVTPPQRIMSESQLNALGLALFLARLKTDPSTWRTMVLDDIVTSLDDVHQARLVRLLGKEFADWQVLLLTHDQTLARAVAVETPDWASEKVVAWTPAEGPSFGSSDMRKRLQEKLDAGEPADELGGVARQAMEEALERPLRKMGLKIRHDPDNRYTADEYRRALVDGLTIGSFPRADDPVLVRLQTAGSVTNKACHYKDREPGVTEQDLRLLLEDLEELKQLFHCDKCGKKAWEVPHRTSARCQCKCGELSCA